ncbi:MULTISPECIES: ArsR/SmtB family transcription factor [Halobacteriales]|mgnify:CR=1 FL=1|uniref:ArsR/SmtB family transcription factor n=1 Tax=Halohasta litorea TaxID=869891 RepID=A0ABD6DF32_9EURY|nr:MULTISPECIES: helix-turn-helix domain-containing protein [Halobacteria]MDL0122403.1 helix-turn-helix domain-containing protein [Halobacterium salinarum]MDL0136548.1 helix-turn-helix domain-containing protein [Halobacterium salinarum]MDL0140512.1 helix-turn-helix domain-containing protein [Halobacterium salinarum]
MTTGENSQSAALLELFADDYSREILLAADESPRTAKELSQRCDASLATIYRRISTLQEHGLIRVHSTIGSGGEHKQLFETTIETLQLVISDGELELSIETRDELADNFTTLWNNFRENI